MSNTAIAPTVRFNGTVKEQLSEIFYRLRPTPGSVDMAPMKNTLLLTLITRSFVCFLLYIYIHITTQRVRKIRAIPVVAHAGNFVPAYVRQDLVAILAAKETTRVTVKKLEGPSMPPHTNSRIRKEGRCFKCLTTTHRAFDADAPCKNSPWWYPLSADGRDSGE